MDLAKIRKKSLQTSKEAEEVLVIAPATSPEPVNDTPESTQVVPATTETDCFQKRSCCTLYVPIAAAVTQLVAPARVPALTPLEAILAGRRAAGCDDGSILAGDSNGEVVTASCLEFLCFRVHDEVYGINIMDIKEIIKPREVTEVPRAPSFVPGVLSLRGTIIPIIDIRVRLGMASGEHTGKERIIVIKNSNFLSGLLVDEVTQVVQVEQDAIEPAPAVLEGIDRDVISGLGRSDGRLIIILNLETIADINLY
ncbi:MAG: chemotaxis protein CheW [Desulfuromonadaceae bacterium]|nr:chemotaxis protein CheW [Desulfuromonadaceae bacterium]